MSPVKDPSRYPPDWKEIRARILKRSADSDDYWGGVERCECTGECGGSHIWVDDEGRCLEANHEKALTFKGQVVLTIAHLNHTPEDCAEDNLKAMCQGCHNRYDRDFRAANRRAAMEAGTERLFEVSS